MNIKECYEKIGSNFDDVKQRLLNEDMVQKFALKFIDVPDFASLKAAVEGKNWADAFLASHTIKGVAQNLGFDKLGSLASDLTENLRNSHPENAEQEGVTIRLYSAVMSEYQRVILILTEFKDSLK